MILNRYDERIPIGVMFLFNIALCVIGLYFAVFMYIYIDYLCFYCILDNIMTNVVILFKLSFTLVFLVFYYFIFYVLIPLQVVKSIIILLFKEK